MKFDILISNQNFLDSLSVDNHDAPGFARDSAQPLNTHVEATLGDEPGMGRRSILRGAGVLGVAGAVAAVGLGQGGDRASAATHSPAPVQSPAATSASKRPTLRRGSRGHHVLYLQKRLAGSGFWVGTADGSFGRLTQQAVYAVQKSHGLSRDGVCGPNTWRAVNSGRRAKARTLRGTHIEIDLDRQLLLYITGGRVLYALNTSTGSGKPFTSGGVRYSGKTHRGDYRMERRKTGGWVHGALGSMYKPLYFRNGLAIHGSNFVPPYPDSHGCCRLTPEAHDRMLARGVPRGCRVWVY